MKRISAILLVLACSAQLYADLLEPYIWRAPLASRWSSNSLHCVPIPASVLVNSRTFPADIRIVDDAGNEWPFYIVNSETGSPHLVFQAGPGGNPHLYFGSPLFKLPRYDLQRRVGPGLPAAALAARLGERESNPAHLAAILETYKRKLVAVALGLSGILAALLVWRRWRQRA